MKIISRLKSFTNYLFKLQKNYDDEEPEMGLVDRFKAKYEIEKKLWNRFMRSIIFPGPEDEDRLPHDHNEGFLSIFPRKREEPLDIVPVEKKRKKGLFNFNRTPKKDKSGKHYTPDE